MRFLTTPSCHKNSYMKNSYNNKKYTDWKKKEKKIFLTNGKIADVKNPK